MISFNQENFLDEIDNITARANDNPTNDNNNSDDNREIDPPNAPAVAAGNNENILMPTMANTRHRPPLRCLSGDHTRNEIVRQILLEAKTGPGGWAESLVHGKRMNWFSSKHASFFHLPLMDLYLIFV